MFHAVMGGFPAVANVTNLGNLSPRHTRQLGMHIDNELAHLRWECLGSFSLLSWLLRGEQASHPISFKFIRFAGKGTLSSVDFLCPLSGGFAKKQYGPELFIQFLLRPEGPLLNACPLIRSLSANSFRSRHLPCLYDAPMIMSSIPDPPNWCKKSGQR